MLAVETGANGGKLVGIKLSLADLSVSRSSTLSHNTVRQERAIQNSPTVANNGAGSFAPSDLAFALAWPDYIPGLVSWTVCLDTDDAGNESVLVDPPLVFGSGYQIQWDGAAAVISWSVGKHRAASLRDAMLTICPLSPEALAAVDALAAAFTPAV